MNILCIHFLGSRESVSARGGDKKKKKDLEALERNDNSASKQASMKDTRPPPSNIIIEKSTKKGQIFLHKTLSVLTIKVINVK